MTRTLRQPILKHLSPTARLFSRQPPDRGTQRWSDTSHHKRGDAGHRCDICLVRILNRSGLDFPLCANDLPTSSVVYDAFRLVIFHISSNILPTTSTHFPFIYLLFGNKINTLYKKKTTIHFCLSLLFNSLIS